MKYEKFDLIHICSTLALSDPGSTISISAVTLLCRLDLLRKEENDEISTNIS